MQKYILTYYEWGVKKQLSFDTYEAADLEAYQKARNSEVYINEERVYANYQY